MNLYLLRQKENSDYDTFDSCVVCAENETEAVNIMPDFGKGKQFEPSSAYGAWAFTLSAVECEYIGIAAPNIEKGIVIASFNAG